MRKFEDYQQAETWLIGHVIDEPEFITKTTFEKFGTGFILRNPQANKNSRSNYEYADKFFEWMLSGEKDIDPAILKINPWVKRFVDTVGLPENFSSSYGWKIQEQIQDIFREIGSNKESRRGYLNILRPEDNIIRTTDTTHEYPCTIGLHFFMRDSQLHLMTNMRSNNLYSVMPYDVYNFTMLQSFVAGQLNLSLGWYYHGINSAHIFRGDARRWREYGH